MIEWSLISYGKIYYKQPSIKGRNIYNKHWAPRVFSARNFAYYEFQNAPRKRKQFSRNADPAKFLITISRKRDLTFKLPHHTETRSGGDF